jgi:flagellar basal body-associated protein FliL
MKGREFLEASIARRDRERRERQHEQRNRQRLLVSALILFAVLTVGASIAAIFAFWQKGVAEKADERTRTAASQANVSPVRYSHEAGNDAQALAHLAQALRLNLNNSGAAALACAMLIQTGWPLSWRVR